MDYARKRWRFCHCARSAAPPSRFVSTSRIAGTSLSMVASTATPNSCQLASVRRDWLVVAPLAMSVFRRRPGPRNNHRWRAPAPARETLLIGALAQQSFVLGVGEAAELDQRRRDIGRGQHGEPGGAVRSLEQRHGTAKLLDNRLRQRQRPVVGLPARQVEQDRADLARLMRQTHAGDEMVPVLAPGEGRGIAVGGLVDRV